MGLCGILVPISFEYVAVWFPSFMGLCGTLVLTAYLLWVCVALWFPSLMGIVRVGSHLRCGCVAVSFPSLMGLVGSLVPLSFVVVSQLASHLLWGSVEYTPYAVV